MNDIHGFVLVAILIMMIVFEKYSAFSPYYLGYVLFLGSLYKSNLLSFRSLWILLYYCGSYRFTLDSTRRVSV